MMNIGVAHNSLSSETTEFYKTGHHSQIPLTSPQINKDIINAPCIYTYLPSQYSPTSSMPILSAIYLNNLALAPTWTAQSLSAPKSTTLLAAPASPLSLQVRNAITSG